MNWLNRYNRSVEAQVVLREVEEILDDLFFWIHKNEYEPQDIEDNVKRIMENGGTTAYIHKVQTKVKNLAKKFI